MSTLQDWIIHRAKTVKLAWPQGVADASGVASTTLDSISVSGNLAHVGRGARGYIARALKISVRELEALASGQIDWIADERIIDLDRLSPTTNAVWRLPVPCPFMCRPGMGVPVLGRVLQDGKVEHFGDWTPEDGPRLSIRYAGFPDAFAVELTIDVHQYPAGECLAFQPIAPGEMPDGELVLLTRADNQEESEVCTIRRADSASASVTVEVIGTHEQGQIALGGILRAARVIGSGARHALRE